MKLLAQINNPVLDSALGGKGVPTADGLPAGGNVLGKLISSLIGGLFIAGFLLSVVYLIMGAVSWITSGGDKAALEKARNEITNAIIGIILVGAAYAMASLIAQWFGLKLDQLPIPSINL